MLCWYYWFWQATNSRWGGAINKSEARVEKRNKDYIWRQGKRGTGDSTSWYNLFDCRETASSIQERRRWFGTGRRNSFSKSSYRLYNFSPSSRRREDGLVDWRRDHSSWLCKDDRRARHANKRSWRSKRELEVAVPRWFPNRTNRWTTLKCSWYFRGLLLIIRLLI